MPRILPDWLDSYMDFVDMTEPPILFKEWCAISTIAACLKRKCWMEWETQVYPNMYIVLIGPSASKKGTAMFPAASFLREVGIKLAAESLTREALIKILTRSIESYMPDSLDATKLIYHSSITIFSQELAVFIGQNQPSLISALTDWWDCRDPWIYETKGGGEEIIEKTWVNLIGATTPDLLGSILPQDAIGGGLTSRIIFVYGSKRSKKVALPYKYINTSKAIKLRDNLLKDLEIIAQIQGEFKPTDKYISLYERWYDTCENIELKREPNYAHYIGRRSVHLRKLTMVMSASRGDDMVLNELDYTRALNLLEATEKLMPQVYKGFGKSELAEIFPKLLATIAEEGGCYVGELLRIYHRDISEEDLLKVLNTLKQMEPPKVVMTIKEVEAQGETVRKRWVRLA